MCAAIPGQVRRVDPLTAVVQMGSSEFEVGRLLVPDARAGDWVLVNAGQIVQTISAQEADAIRDLLRAVMDFGQEEKTCSHRNFYAVTRSSVVSTTRN